MTHIYIKGLPSAYEAEHLVRMFLHNSCLAKTYPAAKTVQNAVYVRVCGGKIVCGVRQAGVCHIENVKTSDIMLDFNSRHPVFGTLQSEKYTKEEFRQKRIEYTVCLMLYILLRNLTGQKPPWGMLTGVRPVRLIHDMRRAKFTEQEIKHRFLEHFFVTEEKYNLSLRIAQEQESAMMVQGTHKRPYSLYIAIPFCPTRCSYCSFVSAQLAQTQKLIAPYLEKLHEELRHISQIAHDKNLELMTIYIGGGTPTAISALQLQALMETVKQNFDINSVYEYTVEAGRPDCTDAEKLEVIKENGATRISINPQTLCDDVLVNIGRKHTADDIIECFKTARKLGHNNINADIIAGLPGDTQSGFEYTLNGVLSLAPENITVHTLTLKRAADLMTKSAAKQSEDVMQMVKTAHKFIASSSEEYVPYYLYRQKSTPGNLENTGYAKKHFTGLYNIFIMEEIHTIISAGAGGVSKLVNGKTGEILRIFNHKYPHEYIERFEIVTQRKKGVDEFYDLDT